MANLLRLPHQLHHYIHGYGPQDHGIASTLIFLAPLSLHDQSPFDMGKMFLLAVGAHSKRAEVVEMPSISTEKTILTLRHMFATLGLPRQVVSDNGPQCRPAEFADFMRGMG